MAILHTKVNPNTNKLSRIVVISEERFKQLPSVHYRTFQSVLFGWAPAGFYNSQHFTVELTMKIKLSGDVDIHYEKVGTGSNVLLLLPGTFGTIEKDFGLLFENLDKEKYTLVSWDPPGYGKSRPPNRDFEDFDRPKKDARLVAELMQKLDFQRYSILGFCAGGATGLILASYYPEVVDKIVCWGTKAFVNDDDKAQVRKFATGELQFQGASGNANLEIYGDEVIDMYTRFGVAFQKMSDICTAELVNVKCPVLILHGALDNYILENHPRYLHENIKGSMLHIIPDGKHFIQHKPEFYQVIEKFLLKPT